MTVNDKQTKYLRGLAHDLKPVVMIGNKGLTEAVTDEIDVALEHHELIKIRISGQERADRKATVDAIAAQTDSYIVHVIGHIAALYRPSKKALIQLPK